MCWLETCQQPPTITCSACNQAVYCTSEHQREDWPNHARECGSMAQVTAQQTPRQMVFESGFSGSMAATPESNMASVSTGNNVGQMGTVDGNNQNLQNTMDSVQNMLSAVMQSASKSPMPVTSHLQSNPEGDMITTTKIKIKVPVNNGQSMYPVASDPSFYHQNEKRMQQPSSQQQQQQEHQSHQYAQDHRPSAERNQTPFGSNQKRSCQSSVELSRQQQQNNASSSTAAYETLGSACRGVRTVIKSSSTRTDVNGINREHKKKKESYTTHYDASGNATTQYSNHNAEKDQDGLLNIHLSPKSQPHPGNTIMGRQNGMESKSKEIMGGRGNLKMSTSNSLTLPQETDEGPSRNRPKSLSTKSFNNILAAPKKIAAALTTAPVSTFAGSFFFSCFDRCILRWFLYACVRFCV